LNKNEAPPQEQPQAAPMDGASPAPVGDPMVGGDAAMGGDPMMGDPAMGGDPMAGEQPPMDGQDPAMGGDPMASEQPPMDGGEGDDSTMSIINQLSDEDREAVRAYAESMLNNSNSEASSNNDVPMNGEEPVMESVIFTKKQLRTIMEGIGNADIEPETDNRRLNKKKDKSVSKKSPFNSPNFK
jgi:hypothetical protein